MDRNLAEQLKVLSKELAAIQSDVQQHGDEYTDDKLDKLYDRIEDLQDEIWGIEDQIRERAEYEYDEHSAKGWN